MDTTISLEKYLEDISSNSPTPGGGNVSAFSGALACSLGIMVCNLTIGKKKYAEVEEDMKKSKEALIGYKDKFIELSRKDNEAFEKVMEVFKLPKETEEEKKERSRRIEETTIEAGIVPSEVVMLCRQTADTLIETAEKGNQNSLSDAGVALSLLNTAAQGAYLNVMINCTPYTDNMQAKKVLLLAGNNFNETESICRKGIEEITKKLGA